MENICPSLRQLLVARNVYIHQRIHNRMYNVSKHKNITHPTRIPLMPNEVPEGLWQTVTMDFITDLPQVGPYDSIHVTVDRSTKGVMYAPCAKTIDVEGTTDLYIKNVWK